MTPPSISATVNCTPAYTTPKWLPFPFIGTEATACPLAASITVMPILCAGGMVASIAPFIMSTRLVTTLTLRAAPDDHAPAVLGGVRDPTGVHRLVGCGGRVDNEVPQHCSKHHIHLHIREHRADAPSGAAAERNP